MAANATILADSISPNGCRLTSIEATYGRIVHSEMMTHRVFSRNSASTRAIPISIQLRNLLANPFIPERFGINQRGMQSAEFLEGAKHDRAVELWLRGRDRAVTNVIEMILGTEIAEEVLGYDSNREYVPGDVLLERLPDLTALFPKSDDEVDLSETSMLNVHKQLAGRGLEAYMWHTIVLTGTEFENFFALRDHPEAQGEIAQIARLMRQAYEDSTPKQLEFGEWHLPYVKEGEFDQPFDGIRASAARAAAASYGRQYAEVAPEKEFGRYNDLVYKGHMSPLEHQGTPFSGAEHTARTEAAMAARTRMYASLVVGDVNQPALNAVESLNFSGNLRGWTQHRKQISHEANFGLIVGTH